MNKANCPLCNSQNTSLIETINASEIEYQYADPANRKWPSIPVRCRVLQMSGIYSSGVFVLCAFLIPQRLCCLFAINGLTANIHISIGLFNSNIQLFLNKINLLCLWMGTNLMSYAGLSLAGHVSGAEHALVFRRIGPIQAVAFDSAVKRAKILGPILNVIWPVASKCKRIINKLR